MLRFLKQKDRRLVKTEYFLRVFSIILLMLFLLGIIATLLLLPTHILSREKSKDTIRIANEVLTDAEVIDPASIVKEINEIIKMSKPKDQGIAFSDTVENIIISDSKGVALLSFTFDRQPKGQVKVSLKGNAKTRDDLSDFIKELRKNSFFESVELPVSGFAKSSDIDFSINIITKI